MTSARDPRLAQVKLHPAAIVVGCLAISVFSRNVWNLKLAPEALLVLRCIGIALEILGVSALVLSYGSMARSRTTIDPSLHSSTIVTSGLYAYSRNPIYLGWFLLIAGMGFRAASPLVLAIAVTMLVLLRWAVVVEEEKYLEKRFGEAYLSYKNRVRRWL